MAIGSIQTTEEGKVATLAGNTLFTSAMDNVLTSITVGADNKFEVTGIFSSSRGLHSDVLLDSIQATAPDSKVPEPGSVVLLGTGLLASMSLLRRRTRNQQ